MQGTSVGMRQGESELSFADCPLAPDLACCPRGGVLLSFSCPRARDTRDTRAEAVVLGCFSSSRCLLLVQLQALLGHNQPSFPEPWGTFWPSAGGTSQCQTPKLPGNHLLARGQA